MQKAIYLKDTKTILTINDFKIVSINNKNKILIFNKEIDYFIFFDKCVFSCNTPKNFQQKNIITFLLEQKSLPRIIRDMIIPLNETKIDKIIECYTDNNFKHFIKNPSVAKYYGMSIENIKLVSLKVIKSFNDIEEFEKSTEINDSNNTNIFVYGLWDIDKNEIPTEFIFTNTLSVRTAFFDLGKSHVEKGSLFLKLMIENIKENNEKF